jgi:demethylmenaquinone methyltransferase/2-methoxy-6-polyprenyl-1,4-benzoquinol methylase
LAVQSALVIQVPPGASAPAELLGGKPAIQRIPPHITLLYPFAPPKELRAVIPALARVCAQVDPFPLTLNRYGRFETALFLEPDDPRALLDLFRRLSAAFSKYPPYGGEFGPDLRPHLTLAEYKEASELEALTLPPAPSLTFIVDRLHIFTGDPDRPGSWRSRAEIPLGMASSQSQRVRRMFARIARRYDLMNRLMTFGQDVRWRREVIRRAGLRRGARLLDLGSGTGDLAFEALRQRRGAHITCVDFTPEMMELGRQREGADRLGWTTADAHRLPFSSQTFDAVVSGFLLRNVSDLDQTLAEQVRVLKPGGRLIALDTAPPMEGPLRPLLRFHLHRVIPALGLLVTGDAEAYNYLPDSTEQFLAPENLTEKMRAAGLQDVGFTRKMLGTVAICWGRSSTK